MIRQRLFAIAICAALALAGLSVLTFAQGTFPGLLGPNQLVGSVAGGVPLPLAINGGASCTNALIYTNGVGFGCNVSAGTGTVTSITPSTGLSPNTAITSSGTIFLENISPGGRLTLVSNTPVMTTTQTGLATLYYTSYVNRFVPIYNGTNTQLYPLCAAGTTGACEISLALAASANWAANSVFDVFAYNNAGTPALCTVAWTNNTTRATALAQFSGNRTNAGVATCRTGAASTISLAANQGSYIGSFCTDAATAGQISWTYGTTAATPGAGRFCVFNANNRVNVASFTADSTASWTYNSITIRQAHAAATFQTVYVSGLGEESIAARYWSAGVSAATNGYVGIGVDSTTTFSQASTGGPSSNSALAPSLGSFAGIPGIGLHTISANEQVQTAASVVTFFGHNIVGQQTGLSFEARL